MNNIFLYSIRRLSLLAKIYFMNFTNDFEKFIFLFKKKKTEPD